MNIKELIIKIMKPINAPVTKSILKRHYRGEKQLATDNQAKRVLVLAPHMDDETIGSGGTLRKHANAGAEVHCVFITDGSNSVSELSKDELVEARKREISMVKDILGIHHVHYMSLPDGHLVSDERSQNMLMDIIEEVQPDLIYSTLFVDAHPDHTATAEILADAIHKLGKTDFLIRLYEINCAIPPEYINCIVDISDTYDRKEEAIDKFVSQAIAFDGFLTLNKLKAQMIKEPKPFAVEVFLELTGEDLIKHKEGILKYKKDFPKMFKQINRQDTLLWAIYQNLKKKKQIYDESFKELSN